MTILIVLACLAGEPHRCGEFQTPLEADGRLPHHCAAAMMEWSVAHPAWRIKRARCGKMEWKA
jgi:hypothetical protein